tara:strand:- start:252 stop:380 length:129 start_codon:yes stop_codon:yes gene_type:complete
MGDIDWIFVFNFINWGLSMLGNIANVAIALGVCVIAFKLKKA